VGTRDLTYPNELACDCECTRGLSGNNCTDVGAAIGGTFALAEYALYSVDLGTGALTKQGLYDPTRDDYYDWRCFAIDPHTSIAYGLTYSQLYRINLQTAEPTFLFNLNQYGDTRDCKFVSTNRSESDGSNGFADPHAFQSVLVAWLYGGGFMSVDVSNGVSALFFQSGAKLGWTAFWICSFERRHDLCSC